MKTHTVPIITNGPLCGEACPWLQRNSITAACLLWPMSELDVEIRWGRIESVGRCSNCRHVTERAEALP